MIFSWIAFIFCGIICSIFQINLIFTGDLEAVSWAIVIFVSVFMLFDCSRKFKSYSWIAIISYFLRVFLMAWDRYFSNIFALPNSGYDSENFQRIAVEIAKNPNSSSVGRYLYTDMLSLIYRMFGNQRIIGQFINILLSISAIYIFYIVLNKIHIEKKYVQLSLLLISFSPNYAIMSSILLRESIISFLISLSLLLFVIWINKNSNFFIICAIVSCIIASLFHAGAIAPAFGYAIIWVLYDSDTKKYSLSLKSILSVLLIFSIAIILNQVNDEYFSSGIFGKSALESVEAHENENGGATYVVGIPIENDTLNYIVNTPIRVFYFILSPMPWDWRGINDMIAFALSSVFYVFGFVFCYKAIRSAYKRKKYDSIYMMLISLLIILSTAFIIFSWGVTNSGTAMRHRDKFISIYVLMTVMSIYELKNNQISEAKK